MSLRTDVSISRLGPGPRILEQAHALVTAGVPVFPVFGIRRTDPAPWVEWNDTRPITVEWRCTCGRDYDDHKPGKHPATAHGHLDAALHDDREIVRIWGDGDKNLAYRTGDGLVVLDVDEKNGGLETLDEWEQWTGFSLPTTLTARTGGGGRHLLYSTNPLDPVITRPGVLPGIDVKATGGYCIAPGSRHVSGRSYEWVDPAAPLVEVSAELRCWLLWHGEVNRPRGGTGLETPGNYDFTQGARAGQRDAFFNDLAFRSRKEGLDWDEAHARQWAAWCATEQPAGDVYTWPSALAKLERVWQRVQPDDQVRAAGEVLARWNTARDGRRRTGTAPTVVTRERRQGL